MKQYTWIATGLINFSLCLCNGLYTGASYVVGYLEKHISFIKENPQEIIKKYEQGQEKIKILSNFVQSYVQNYKPQERFFLLIKKNLLDPENIGIQPQETFSYSVQIQGFLLISQQKLHDTLNPFSDLTFFSRERIQPQEKPQRFFRSLSCRYRLEN